MQEWLDWIGSVHTTEIELGLDRIKLIANKLQLLTPACPVITVGGTNGKGSTVAGLEAIYRAAGYKTGAFTSPILFRHNEYVRIDGIEASDADFCQAYAAIEAVRGEISLTPFEYHTLAALIIFKQADLGVMLLEVGLGGRLDAVNIIDADVAVVASIGIDHAEWLGGTREAIAREKAGIFRQGRVAVYGESDMPASIREIADQQQVSLYHSGRDFNYQTTETDWCWQYKVKKIDHLPFNRLAIQNMANVLMVLELLQARLPVTDAQIRAGLKAVALTGRIQVIAGKVTQIFDVAHNPAAILFLAERLAHLPCEGKTLAVFSMLADKDIAGSIKVIENQMDEWFVAPLTVKRGASMQMLQEKFAGKGKVNFYASLIDAYQAALKQAEQGDRVVVFGSFNTVAAVLKD